MVSQAAETIGKETKTAKQTHKIKRVRNYMASPYTGCCKKRISFCHCDATAGRERNANVKS